MAYRYNITWQFVAAFFALVFLLAEMHELVHTNIGYLFGGCYGERDFNVWGLCEASSAHPMAYWATLAGPIFTFAVMWAAYFMLKRAREIPAQAFAVALLFASFPFGRIFTVLMGGGDEYLVVRNLFADGESDPVLWGLTAAVIVGICVVPLIAGWRILPEKRRLLSFSALFIGPLFVVLLILLLGLNGLLTMGYLNGPGLLGAPLMITLWFGLCVLVTYLLRASLSNWLS